MINLCGSNCALLKLILVGFPELQGVHYYVQYSLLCSLLPRETAVLARAELYVEILIPNGTCAGSGQNRIESAFLNRFICLVKFHSKYFNCNTDNILHFHVNFQQHSVAFIRLLPQYYNQSTTIRDKKKLSQTEMWRSAITDHAMQENHLIDWESARIIEKERDDKARGIKEAVHIRILPNMNRD